ncbi:MAG TPA: hypothetical protein VF101_09190 [Gaiellaceae bacterium]
MVLIASALGRLAYGLREQRLERLERLNRESWQVLRTARRIHDETAAALQAMFDAAGATNRTHQPGR